MCVSLASMKLRRNERAVAIIGGTVGVPLRLAGGPIGSLNVSNAAVLALYLARRRLPQMELGTARAN